MTEPTFARHAGRTRGQRPYRWGVAAAVLALALAGCGGSDDPASTASSGSSKAQSTLAVSIGSEPGSLDPLFKSDGPRDTFGQSVYEGLTTREGNSKESTIVPKLATKWELKGKSWIFTLRDGVTFHDGTPLTADDVAASWNRMIEPGSENRDSKVFADTVIKAVDDKTVSISRPVADPTTPARAALVMTVPKEWAAKGDERLSSKMMGTGPYKFDGWTRGQKIKLSEYPEYWGDKPSIPNVEVGFAEEVAVRQAALQAGEIQMALNMSPELASDEYQVKATPVSEVSIMRLNSEHGPLKDLRVRQAADLAIDRPTLMKQIWGGYAATAGGQEVAPYVFGHNQSMKETAYDPDKARQLLKAAGQEKVKIEVWGTRGHWTNDAQLGEAVVGMLNEVGFAAELKQPPFDSWVKKVFIAEKNDAGSPDVMLYNHSNELFDSSLTIGQNLTCKGTSSTTCIPEVDKLADEALATANDQDKRQQLYDQAWQILYDNAAYVSLAEVQKVTFLDKDVKWTPEPDGFIRFQNIEFAQ